MRSNETQGGHNMDNSNSKSNELELGHNACLLKLELKMKNIYLKLELLHRFVYKANDVPQGTDEHLHSITLHRTPNTLGSLCRYVA